MRVGLLFASSLLFACGSVADDAPQPAGAPDPVGTKPTSASYGDVFATVTTSVTANGQPGYLLGAKLETPTPKEDACKRSSKTVGACCFVPPATTTPPPTSGLPAGATPDGSPTYVDESAGKIAFTSGGAPMGSIDYGPTKAGFGQGRGYPNLMINPTSWSPGDLLGVSAEGADGHVPAFAASLRGVDLPNAATPTRLARSAAVSFSWKPDPNATTMTLTLSSFANGTPHGTVVCAVADAAGGFSVDPSLLASFDAGDKCWGSLERSASKTVELAGGHVTFSAKGEQTFVVPVE